MHPGSNDTARCLPDPRELDLGPSESIPVVVVTGFLGSGKTTLIKRLLANSQLRDTAVIVNEFGEVGFDHELVEVAKEDTILLAGGCLCCASRGDLVRALQSLLERRERLELPYYKRVIVETSGLADPVPLLQTFIADPMRLSVYKFHRLIALVDAMSGESTLTEHELARRQIALADLLFMSKTDMFEKGEVQSRLETLQRHTGRTIEPMAADEALIEAMMGPPCQDAPSLASLPDHLHAARDYESVNRQFVKPIPYAVITDWLAATVASDGDRILRIKGVLRTHEGAVSVDAVQHQWHLPRLFGGSSKAVGYLVVVVPAGSDAGGRVLQRLQEFSG